MTIAPGLFGRLVGVELGIPGASGLRITGLRIAFKVDHKASATASTGTIRIWNPAPSTIALIQAPGAAVRLFVGYEPNSRLIFWGNPVKDGVNVRTEGPDRVLEIDAADGGAAYASTFLQVSYSTPTTSTQIIATILAQTLWSQGSITIPEVTFPHGIVMAGKPGAVLDRLAASVPPFGADWFVRDNALYVVPRGQATPEAAPLLSSTAGNLIGSPSSTVGSPTSAASATRVVGGVKARALIDATMRPGRSFVVQSQHINGMYVARDVSFVGDSGYADEFYMDIVGRPMGVA